MDCFLFKNQALSKSELKCYLEEIVKIIDALDLPRELGDLLVNPPSLVLCCITIKRRISCNIFYSNPLFLF